jgi:hypothetical protein
MKFHPLILPISTECGGYVNGEGLVSSPNYLSDADDIDDCYWFVEARQKAAVVYLKRQSFTFSNGLIYLPIITVSHIIRSI